MGQSPVIGKIAQFGKELAVTALKAVAKHVTNETIGKVPIIGSHVANFLNSKYKHGGAVHKFADGGVVDKLQAKGIQTVEVKTPAQLIQAIKKNPEVAQKVGLSAEMVKDAMKEAKQEKAEPMAEPTADAPAPEPKMMKGGRKHRAGHVQEVPLEEVETHHKKHHHKKHHKVEVLHHKEGGSMPARAEHSLPWNTMNRLNMPTYAHGGYHDVGLHPCHHESYVMLHHGQKHHKAHKHF